MMNLVRTGTAFRAAVCFVIFFVLIVGTARAQRSDSLAIREKAQTLHLYGPASGDPVIVSSGDGGWIHLGPHVAETLAARGFFVVGFDVKTYLESFTSGKATLRAEDEPGDYKVLADYAARSTRKKPILIGVSEGAGLSVLAATDPATQRAILGVIGLGLPDTNELGWRWRDAIIYLTHRVPDEPTFSTAAIVARMSPLPLAAIHSTRDEFVPETELRKVLAAAKDPKRVWMIDAADHRFSGNVAEFDRRLLEAIDWIRQTAQH
jgi:fermentation-respiration switch protein FrsA (DUF1100 family)